jgi:cell division cycle 2-like protein
MFHSRRETTEFLNVLDINDLYEFKKEIDEGAYGRVYKAICRQDKLKVAIKHMKKHSRRAENFKEVEVLSRIRHKNIVYLKQVVTATSGDVFLIYEYLESNLLKYYSVFIKEVNFTRKK